ncbi:MAG: 2-oxoglutarate dehydrogenase complex dihydrolipoyllysine-residue succinyltransferase [Bdellovibrionales bacterium]
MSVAIKVPALGESVSEATVAKWLKNVGDSVRADEPLVELETDKVTVEVNAPAAGTISEITVQTGASVPVGSVLGTIAEGAGATVAPPKASPTAAPDTAIEQPIERLQPPAGAAPVQPKSDVVMPAAARVAAENNIDPATANGTGKDGRVTKEDILNMLGTGKAAAPAAPKAPAAPAGPRANEAREERVKMTRLRQRIAERLKEAQNTAAMLTTFNEIDMSAVMALRAQYKEQFEKKYGVKMGFMSFFVKAAIQALQELPAVNAEIAGDEIIYKNYYDIGVAVGTPQGLVVPVLRDADTKSFPDIEREIGQLAGKARDGKLTMSELTGGTFTITNGGVYGSMMSTPILNPPQSGILGMHKTTERAVVIDGKIEIRPMMYVALTYDHRIIDGREAVTFLVRIKEAIEDPQRLLIAV